ncbi:DUF3619 family protein [Paraburkholderia hayleyella]|uniref:DUF3619 family protein n=1 Tax=Paraburkholderia hayleyella TaxID=2152889 RepID=UPI0012926E2B|nr:DUF3619 family protein [Paraburkholderia hayleyella]
MSPSPETKELEFSRQVRRALDESATRLAPATLSRLAAARHLAVARKKPETVCAPSFVPALATSGAQFTRPQHRPSPLRRLALAWPLVALVLGLVSIAYWEDQQRSAELADIDAAMLSDDLPLNAYLDHGFNAYLSHQR